MSNDLLASIHESEMKHAHALIAELELKNANALQLAVDEHDRLEKLKHLTHRALLALDEDDFPELRQDLRDALGIEDDEPEDEICSGCSGCGEGMYDGSTCNKCHGSGIEPVEKDDEP